MRPGIVHRRQFQLHWWHRGQTPFNGKIDLMPTWAEFKHIIPGALPGPNMIATHPDLFWGLKRQRQTSPPRQLP